ncbi:MAG: metallophosphoesterase [Methyloligellaceae bacterium]
MALYEELFDGPLDIIGDIHGEITALRYLLYNLGYDESGRHKQNRRLVFLGDIVDRGPNSPDVVEAVMSLVKSGRAQCILGNHELNILLNRPMHGNGWMVQPNPKDAADGIKSRVADERRKPVYREFFQSLPLILENSSLRIVHACWNTHAVDAIKKFKQESVEVLYQRFQEKYHGIMREPEFAKALDAEQLHYQSALRDPTQVPPLLKATAKKEYLEQMINPVRTLTTSSMVAAATPYFGGGKWRMAERDAWWDYYQEDKPVIIGHFWRQFSLLNERISGVFGRDLFSDIEPHAWMGANDNVYCVDYSVGQRYLERKRSSEERFYGKLAALRMPERQVMHDDGNVVSTYVQNPR